MIWESHPWKQGLAQTANYFEKLQAGTTITKKQQVAIEKHTFLGFYSIRKLMDARKLSDQIKDRRVSVVIYPPTGIKAHHLNLHKVDRIFNLDNPRKESWDLRRICNQFIHSYVFQIVECDRGYFHSLMVASDHQRAEGLLGLNVHVLIQLFRAVVIDDVASVEWKKDQSKEGATFVLSNTSQSPVSR